MKVFKTNLVLALCITLTAALVFAWNFRWTYGPKQSVRTEAVSIIHFYKKDKWTEQNWHVIYGYDGNEDKAFYGVQKPVPNEKNSDAWFLRNALTFAWSVLTFLSLLFSVYGLLCKMKE